MKDPERRGQTKSRLGENQVAKITVTFIEHLLCAGAVGNTGHMRSSLVLREAPWGGYCGYPHPGQDLGLGPGREAVWATWGLNLGGRWGWAELGPKLGSPCVWPSEPLGHIVLEGQGEAAPLRRGCHKKGSDTRWPVRSLCTLSSKSQCEMKDRSRGPSTAGVRAIRDSDLASGRLCGGAADGFPVETQLLSRQAGSLTAGKGVASLTWAWDLPCQGEPIRASAFIPSTLKR